MLQRHRKSQSTSALAVMADKGEVPGLPDLSARDREREKRAKRLSQHPALGRVEEVVHPGSPRRMDSSVPVPGLMTPSKSRRGREMDESRTGKQDGHIGERQERRARSRGAEVGLDEVKAWRSDIMSVRSSERRRLVALKGLEKAFMRSCSPDRSCSEARIDLSTMIGLQLHTPLITLLTGHARALSSRHPPQADELNAIVIELEHIVRILQGLSLLSEACKRAVGEQYVLEIIIDLLLLLRTQPPQPAVEGEQTPHSIVYIMLELLCCILVDSPANSRTFEKLSGLEAVVRVLKGTGVAKEIRMKCLEFLYFYLLPEQNPPARAVSSSSTNSQSSSSSAESMLYPPSPLSSSTSSTASARAGRVSPSPSPAAISSHQPMHRFEDLDVPFIPQTPKKKPQPSLGYLTPSTRRVSGGTALSAATPSLEPVPGSPVDIRIESDAEGSDRTSRRSQPPTPRTDSRRWSVMESSRSQSGAGLGLGLPKSSSMSMSLAAAASGSDDLKRDVTAINLAPPESPRNITSTSASTSTSSFFDPFSDAQSSSSGSSTVVPPRTSSGMSRSSTTSDLTSSSSRLGSASDLASRRLSVRRPSRLAQVSTPNSPDLPAPQRPEGRPQKIRHSRAQSHAPGSLVPSSPAPPMPTSSSAINLAAMGRRRSTPPGAMLPPSTPASTNSPVPPASPAPPTPAKRAFPVELTRAGRMTPSASSPNLLVPLGAARRIPSDHHARQGAGGGREKRDVEGSFEKSREGLKVDKGKGKEVRSVEEKKQLLSSWIGNVDALVEGVEKVSFWGSISKHKR